MLASDGEPIMEVVTEQAHINAIIKTVNNNNLLSAEQKEELIAGLGD